MDILRTYGWAVCVLMAFLFFLYHDLWPWVKQLVERAHEERRDEKVETRRQMDKFAGVLSATEASVRATAQAVNANTHVSQNLADRVAAIAAAVTDLRMESIRRRKERDEEETNRRKTET